LEDLLFFVFFVELGNAEGQYCVAYQLQHSELLPTEQQRSPPNYDHPGCADYAALQSRAVLCERNAEVVERTDAEGCEQDCYQKFVVCADENARFYYFGLDGRFNDREECQCDAGYQYSPNPFPEDCVFDPHIIFFQYFFFVDEHEAEQELRQYDENISQKRIRLNCIDILFTFGIVVSVNVRNSNEGEGTQNNNHVEMLFEREFSFEIEDCYYVGEKKD
jgi:hypothetical protein